nr:FAR1 DNA binding domain, zinc finger, SWIM-type, MULE transposase domain, FHY3/FAR1 family [Tanacetum cinerariifolium]
MGLGRAYGKKAGFDVRRGGEYKAVGFVDATTNKVSDGFERFREPKKKQTRRKPTFRCGCLASLTIKRIGNVFEVTSLIEGHNHPLVAEKDMIFMKNSRNIGYSKQHFLYQVSNANFGPVIGFRLIKQIHRGFDRVGAMVNDCKNQKKKISVFIGDRDAQMAVEKLLSRKLHSPGFYANYYKGFGSVEGGLDLVSHVIRLTVEPGISRPMQVRFVLLRLCLPVGYLAIETDRPADASLLIFMYTHVYHCDASAGLIDVSYLLGHHSTMLTAMLCYARAHSVSLGFHLLSPNCQLSSTLKGGIYGAWFVMWLVFYVAVKKAAVMEVDLWVGCGDVVAVEWGNRGKGWRLVAWQGGGEMVVVKAAGCGWGLWRRGGAWRRVVYGIE